MQPAQPSERPLVLLSTSTAGRKNSHTQLSKYHIPTCHGIIQKPSKVFDMKKLWSAFGHLKQGPVTGNTGHVLSWTYVKTSPQASSSNKCPSSLTLPHSQLKRKEARIYLVADKDTSRHVHTCTPPRMYIYMYIHKGIFWNAFQGDFSPSKGQIENRDFYFYFFKLLISIIMFLQIIFNMETEKKILY